MMTDRQIVISEQNARVLRGLLRTRSGAAHDQEHLDDLRVELDRALVLDPSQLSPTLVGDGRARTRPNGSLSLDLRGAVAA